MPKRNNENQYATKNDLKEMRKEICEDFKTHMGVIYEKFSGDVKLLAEQVQGTNTKVDHLETKMDYVVETVGELKTDITEIKGKLDAKIDIKEHQRLARRVTALEAKA